MPLAEGGETATADDPADTAEAIAARESLNPAADVAAVRRRRARSPRPRSRDGRRSPESYAFTTLSRQATHRRTAQLRPLARDSAQLEL
ncbi:hypothetical protein [Streptomyces sp. NPDC057403]|uniref:hypothetical protein n=1 Tax=Streptomyces sp. NPDC057403 TaxID=3346119 RepID=UPI0036AD156A